MPLLFSYGTLRQGDVQVATFGRVLDGQPDELVGAELTSVRIANTEFVAASGGRYHANVTFNGHNESRVTGMVFTVTEAELSAADTYERPAAYVRRAVTLLSGRRAWVYVFQDGGGEPA